MEEVLKIFLLFVHNIMLRIRQVGIYMSANLYNGLFTLTGVILSHYLFPVGKPIYSRWVVDF